MVHVVENSPRLIGEKEAHKRNWDAPVYENNKFRRRYNRHQLYLMGDTRLGNRMVLDKHECLPYDMRQTNLSDAYLVKAYGKDRNFTGADLSRAIISCDFLKATDQWKNVNFIGTKIEIDEYADDLLRLQGDKVWRSDASKSFELIKRRMDFLKVTTAKGLSKPVLLRLGEFAGDNGAYSTAGRVKGLADSFLISTSTNSKQQADSSRLHANSNNICTQCGTDRYYDAH